MPKSTKKKKGPKRKVKKLRKKPARKPVSKKRAPRKKTAAKPRAKKKKMVKKIVRKSKKEKLSEKELLKHKINNLLQEGRQRGFVTEAEVLEVIPETDEQIELMEKIYNKLAESGVEIAEGEVEMLEEILLYSSL